jgi:hypothetical protein
MAGGIVTVVGAAGGHSIPVTVNGSQAFSLAQAYASAVASASSSGSYFASSVGFGATVPAAPGSSVDMLVATTGGAFTIPSSYN